MIREKTTVITKTGGIDNGTKDKETEGCEKVGLVGEGVGGG